MPNASRTVSGPKTKVTAYRCPDTGQLFESPQALSGHRRKLAKQVAADEARKVLKARYEEIRHQPRLTAKNMRDFAKKLRESYAELAELTKKLNNSSRKLPGITKLWFSNIRLEAERMNESRYNAPVPTESTATKMRLRGQLNVCYDKNPDIFMWSNLTEMFFYVHIGCGGGTSSEAGYRTWNEVTLCLDDFPRIVAQYQAQQALNRALHERDAQIKARVEALLSAHPSLSAIHAEIEKTKQALTDAQQAFAQALNAKRKLQEELKEQAEQENPFDFQQLEALGEFIR